MDTPVVPPCTSSASASARPPPSAKSVARPLIPHPGWPDRLGRWGFAAFFGGAGLAHFVFPTPFVAHLPTIVPDRMPIVYLTGAIEVAFAGALLVTLPPTRRAVAIAIAVYLVLVFPGNIYVAVAGIPVYPSPWMAWARLPLQPLFIVWALRAGR